MPPLEGPSPQVTNITTDRSESAGSIAVAGSAKVTDPGPPNEAGKRALSRDSRTPAGTAQDNANKLVRIARFKLLAPEVSKSLHVPRCEVS